MVERANGRSEPTFDQSAANGRKEPRVINAAIRTKRSFRCGCKSLTAEAGNELWRQVAEANTFTVASR